MKNLMFIGLIVGLFVSIAHAQMSGQTGTKIEQKEKTEQTGMMEKGRMTDTMIKMMDQLSEMLGYTTILISKDMPTDKMKQMSALMKDMSGALMEMSRVMGNGKATEKEMKMIQDDMTKMQKKMSDLETKK